MAKEQTLCPVACDCSLTSLDVAVLCRRHSILGISWGSLTERMELRAMGIKKEAFEQASKALDSYNTLSEKIAHAIQHWW